MSNYIYTVLVLSIGVAIGWVIGVLSRTIFWGIRMQRKHLQLQNTADRAKELVKLAEEYSAGLDVATIKRNMSRSMRADFNKYTKQRNRKERNGQ